MSALTVPIEPLCCIVTSSLQVLKNYLSLTPMAMKMARNLLTDDVTKATLRKEALLWHVV